MRAPYRSPCCAQTGMVLVTTLLLLIVITILALAMFRGTGLDNRIAGNVLDKQRALQAADSAQEYAEQWLYDDVTTTPLVSCARGIRLRMGVQRRPSGTGAGRLAARRRRRLSLNSPRSRAWGAGADARLPPDSGTRARRIRHGSM